MKVPTSAVDAVGNEVTRDVTPQEWYRYYSHERRRHPQSAPNVAWDDTLQRCGRLGQEYVCSGWIKAEDTRLQYLKSVHGQRQIRAELYSHVQDHLDSTDVSEAVGRIVLPSSMRGSPRRMRAAFQDAMATVKVFGTPSLFITMTASAGAPEIKACLHRGQQPGDRWDLCSEVFEAHAQQLIDELCGSGTASEGCFGDAIARFHVLEFQKRGLPHKHILLWLHPDDKLSTAAGIDSVISAQLPTDPAMRRQVLKTQVHECGERCTVDGRCAKRYLKPAATETKLKGPEEPGDFVQYLRDLDAAGAVLPVCARAVVFCGAFVSLASLCMLLSTDAGLSLPVCLSVSAVGRPCHQQQDGRAVLTVPDCPARCAHQRRVVFVGDQPSVPDQVLHQGGVGRPWHGVRAGADSTACCRSQQQQRQWR